MQLRSPLGAHAGLTLMLALVACGCVATPPVMPTAAGTAQTAAARPMGRAVVDLTQVANALSKRHLTAVGFTDNAGIATLRVRAVGPGMDEVTSPSQTYAGLSGAITVDVPQGPNRVFRLEGLTSDGGVVASLSTLANVTSTDPVALSFDIATTAAAYTLVHLQDPLLPGQTDATNLRASLSTVDITEDLKTFVKKATDYNSSTNAVGLVDPRYFRVQGLVNVLLKDGLSAIQPKQITPASPAAIQVPTALTQGTKGVLALAVRTSDGLPVANAPIAAEVFDLNPSSVTASGTDDSGTLKFTDVGIGIFDVKLTLADGSVAWAHDVVVRDTGISYATYTLPSTAAAPPVTVDSSDYNNLPSLAENTRTHEKLLAWAAPSEGTAMRVQVFDDHGQPLSGSVDLGFASNITSVEAAFMQGATASDDRYVVSWLDSEGLLNLAAVQSNGSADPTAPKQTKFYGIDGSKPSSLAVPSYGLVATGRMTSGSSTLVVGRSVLSGEWGGGTPYIGPDDVNNLGVAVAGPSELLVTWQSGSDILAQRVTTSINGGWEGNGFLTVASGVSGSVSRTLGAYDSTHNDYMVGWEWADAEGGHVGLKHLVRAASNGLAAGSANYKIDDTQNLTGSRLRFVPERSEYMLAYRSGAANAIKMQKLVPTSSGLPPSPGTLTKEPLPTQGQQEVRRLLYREQGGVYPNQVTFAYDSKASLYRAAWIRGYSATGSGSLVFGSYRP